MNDAYQIIQIVAVIYLMRIAVSSEDNVISSTDKFIFGIIALSLCWVIFKQFK